jgi:hypothetical protein
MGWRRSARRRLVGHVLRRKRAALLTQERLSARYLTPERGDPSLGRCDSGSDRGFMLQGHADELHSMSEAFTRMFSSRTAKI